MTEALPLSGIRVLDLTRALAGPFCTMILGDLGADVVKVEPTPDGEMTRSWGPFQGGTSVYYLSINRNKRSLAVDFRKPAGLELIRGMAAVGDVVVENFRPGAMDAMGLSAESLMEANPRLVVASVTGFGRDGPYGDWPGVDQIAQGMSGFMSITGQAEGEPTRVGLPIGDVCAGMWIAIGIQAALMQRHATGRGQRVETSLLAGLVAMLNVQGQRQLSLGDTPRRIGNDHPVICPYGGFHAADGPFNMAALTNEMWGRLCRLTGLDDMAADPDYADNQARMKNREAMKRRLNAVFATRPRMHWVGELVRLGLPAGPIYDMDEVFRDPQVRHAGMVETVEHPEIGKLDLLSSPLRLDTIGAATVRLPPPVLGQHSAEALADWGIDPARIAALCADGVVTAREAARARA